jgi:DNA-binding NtrC family response regulator
VDPDEAFGHVLQTVLGSGYELQRISTVEKGISQLEAKDLDVILLNLDSPPNGPAAQDPRDLLRAASDRGLVPPVIVYSWDARPGRALEAFQLAAADFLEQPLDIRELKFALDAACRRTSLTRDLAAAKRFLQTTPVEGLLGNSKAMEQVNEIIRKVADVATTVLITGESGTGKGVAARAIHKLSPRAERPFVAFSPSALPESLIEDELFGHEKGAFTGAAQTRRGRFEEANGGTIFLDEIGDLALPLQAKLLRVLQERSLERLGSNAAHPVDVRVICATSRNLGKMVQEGSFREDLYFRISVVRIHMPPLRERAGDIPLLAEFFLRMFAKTQGCARPDRGVPERPGRPQLAGKHSRIAKRHRTQFGIGQRQSASGCRGFAAGTARPGGRERCAGGHFPPRCAFVQARTGARGAAHALGK